MYAKYEANLNIDGTGAIVAAPDLETPGERNISVENDCEIAGIIMYFYKCHISRNIETAC